MGGGQPRDHAVARVDQDAGPAQAGAAVPLRPPLLVAALVAMTAITAAGHLVASARMDGAPWIAPAVALGKAWTAAAYGLPSAAQGEKMKDLHAFSASISTRITGEAARGSVIGRPIPDLSVHLLDPAGQPLPLGSAHPLPSAVSRSADPPSAAR